MGKILLLDDDEDLLDALSDLIRALTRNEVISVGSVGELKSRDAEALGCDLAILDINLGSGNPSGIDAYDWLKQRQFGGRISFLTGHATSHPLVAAAGRLDATVLRKPCGFDELRPLLPA